MIFILMCADKVKCTAAAQQGTQQYSCFIPAGSLLFIDVLCVCLPLHYPAARCTTGTRAVPTSYRCVLCSNTAAVSPKRTRARNLNSRVWIKDNYIVLHIIILMV